MKKILIGLAAVLASLLVPQVALSGPGFRGEGRIVGITVNYHNAGFAVVFDNSIRLNGCIYDREVLVNRSVAGYEEMYSALLVAYVSGKKVNFYVNGSCQNNTNIGTAFILSD